MLVAVTTMKGIMKTLKVIALVCAGVVIGWTACGLIAWHAFDQVYASAYATAALPTVAP